MRISDWSSDVCSSDLEIFLMPAELAGEKEGTFTNTHRLVQWHDKVIDGPGDSRSELWFMYHLGKRLKALYADSTEERDQQIGRAQSELQSLMRISYAVFCLKKKKKNKTTIDTIQRKTTKSKTQ